ncbi:MAG: DUF2267 domain-containing protein [Pseudomonadota bacterium]
MPMPWTYRHASREWAAFLADAREAMSLTSDNMSYTAIDGVFQTFRRRLTAAEGLRFAAILPTVPRAIFVADWDVSVGPVPFADRATMTREAQALRPHHNLTPDNAIEAVAWALRRAVRPDTLDRVLATLPDAAAAFWHVDAPAQELGPRIV